MITIKTVMVRTVWFLNLADGDRVEFADYIKLTPQSTKATATPKASAKATAKQKQKQQLPLRQKQRALLQHRKRNQIKTAMPTAAVSF